MTQQSVVQHDDLAEYLSDLNRVGVGEAVIIEAEGTPWLAYCTDPDAEWLIESGNPADRIDEDGYQSIGLDWLSPNRGPFIVIDRRQAGRAHG